MTNSHEQFPFSEDDISKKADELSAAEEELGKSLENNNFPAERKDPLGIGRGVLSKEDIEKMIKTIEELEKREGKNRKTISHSDGLKAAEKDPPIVRGMLTANPEHVKDMLKKFIELEENGGNKSAS